MAIDESYHSKHKKNSFNVLVTNSDNDKSLFNSCRQLLNLEPKMLNWGSVLKVKGLVSFYAMGRLSSTHP